MTLLSTTAEAEAAVDTPFVVDPSTSASLPTKLTLPSGASYRLVGLGARQVTFLSINVYTVGIYVPDTPAGRSAGAEAREDPASLLTSPATASDLVLYLTPARNTSAAHLRDGFVRALMDAVHREQDETVRAAMLDDVNAFKAAFPKANVEKGQVFLFRRTGAGGGDLVMHHEGVEVGTVQSKWLARALFAAYLRDEKPISPKLRASIVDSVPAGVAF
ncbi:hypothetical protein H9P43_005618 [Blastocladiella emersonii ATCC 22665]|nr:hypothetical protein H9P43_005618 [Blastocladiella emersonii ATCC 22665]